LAIHRKLSNLSHELTADNTGTYVMSTDNRPWNPSDAAMAQRASPKNALDDFPTPPWATRALAEHVITPTGTCLEPACGRGHMSATLAEYFDSVTSSDVYAYGFGEIENYLESSYGSDSFDWVITDPPFILAEKFIQQSMEIARLGIAMLVRTAFIESVDRYNRLFKASPPFRVAQFVERVPMVIGRLQRGASTATAYAWIVWKKNVSHKRCELKWIPPCRRKLERDKDYDVSPIMW
jgi:hypothetical protein